MKDGRTRWERYLDALDTTGGHLLILALLFLVGAGLTAFEVAHGGDVMVASFGAILAVLKTVHSTHTRYKGR